MPEIPESTIPTRKTRGPCTPHERAMDAIRTASTRFAKLPSGCDLTTDDLLKPLAFLLDYERSRWHPSQKHRIAAAEAYQAVGNYWRYIADEFGSDESCPPDLTLCSPEVAADIARARRALQNFVERFGLDSREPEPHLTLVRDDA